MTTILTKDSPPGKSKDESRKEEPFQRRRDDAGKILRNSQSAKRLRFDPVSEEQISFAWPHRQSAPEKPLFFPCQMKIHPQK
ncbi:hypothetical protein J3R74_000295 [Puniceicoccus vermicola]